LSVTVTFTEYEPGVVGVPEISAPVDMVRPGGSPVTDQVSGSRPPLEVTWYEAGEFT
jgi:hypothetical protein